MVPLTPAKKPNLADTRMLICSGKHDPIVPAENAARLAAMLRGGGAKVTMHLETTGHELTSADIAAAKTWLHES
jgi:predicted esterase